MHQRGGPALPCPTHLGVHHVRPRGVKDLDRLQVGMMDGHGHRREAPLQAPAHAYDNRGGREALHTSFRCECRQRWARAYGRYETSASVL